MAAASMVAAPPAARRSDDVPKLVKQYGARPGPVRRGRRRPLRAAPGVRQRHRSGRCRRARALRGRRPLGARRPLAALGAHREDLRAREPQARLLPVDGVPHRPLAGQQHHQPPARAARKAARPAEGPRLARACSSRSRTPAWATAAWGGWRRASSTRWRRCSCRPWATACATSTASSGRPSRTAGRSSSRTTGSAVRIRGRSPGTQDRVEVKLNCSFEVRGGTLQPVPGQPSTLIGIPFDRPDRRLRRQDDQHAAALGRRRGRLLRLPGVQQRRLRRARWPSGSAAESLTRVLYPDDSTSMGQGLRFVQEYFLVACSLADLVRRFRRHNDDWNLLPEKVAIQLNDTHPALAVPELMRILLDEARLGWDEAWDLTRRTLALHEPHAAAGGPGEVAAGVVRAVVCRAIWRSSTRSTAGCSTRCGAASRVTRAVSRG